MRSYILILITLLTITVLAACSIPIGEGEISISSDGITFSENNASDSEEVENESAVPVTTAEENELNDTGDEDAVVDEKNDEPTEQNESADEICDEQDHSALINNIGEDIYIPECAVIQSQSLSSDTTSAQLEIPNSNWEEIAKEYREALSKYGFKEDSDFNSDSIIFRFKPEEDIFSTSIINIQQDENAVRLSIDIYTE